MKRILSIFFCLFLTIAAFAQYDNGMHLKFMGIPIDGTITEFQKKLKSKGVTYDAEASAEMDIGMRAFWGNFSGQQSQIIVYYGKRNKIVYAVKVFQIYGTDYDASNEYSKLKDLFIKKYGIDQISFSENDNKESLIINLFQGEIYLYRTEDEVWNQIQETHILQIQYSDTFNSAANDSSLMEDL